MPRINGSELPSEQELHEILTVESPRMAVRYDYGLTQPHLFDAYKYIAQFASIDTSWIDHFSKMSISETKHRADVATEQMVNYVLATPNDYRELYSRLCIDDTPSTSDVVFVFGSPADARIELAVKLYSEKISDKIIVSGKGPYYGANDATEAARMARVAYSKGVPKHALIEEHLSITMPDNVKRTIDMLSTMNWQPKSILAIASSFTQRRAQMEWYKFLPWDAVVRITSPPANELPLYMRSGMWAESQRGVATLLNEYNKIIVEQAMDLYRAGKVQ